MQAALVISIAIMAEFRQPIEKQGKAEWIKYYGHDPFVETETVFRSVSVNLRDPFVKQTGFAKLAKPDRNAVSLSKPYKYGGGYGRHKVRIY